MTGTLRAVDYRDLLHHTSGVSIAVHAAQRGNTGLETAAARAADLVNTLAQHGYQLRHVNGRWTT